MKTDQVLVPTDDGFDDLFLGLDQRRVADEDRSVVRRVTSDVGDLGQCSVLQGGGGKSGNEVTVDDRQELARSSVV